LIDIASQEIRSHRRDLQESVPPEVAQFIHKHRLYGFAELTQKE
jgi:hypothetical protein